MWAFLIRICTSPVIVAVIILFDETFFFIFISRAIWQTSAEHDKQCFYVTVTGKRVGGYYKYVWIKHLTQLFPSRANPPKGKTFQSTVLRLCAVEFVAVALIFMYGNDKPVYSVTVFNQTTVCSCVSELSCKALTFMCLQLSSWSLNIAHPIVILKPWHCAYNSNVKALTLCLQ